MQREEVKITKETLKKIGEDIEVIKFYPETDTPRIWLYRDPATFSYILVRHSYKDHKKQRSFNHIMFDYYDLNDLSTEIPDIFQEAIKKIEEGNCLIWQGNKTFILTPSCSKPHS